MGLIGQTLWAVCNDCAKAMLPPLGCANPTKQKNPHLLLAGVFCDLISLVVVVLFTFFATLVVGICQRRKPTTKQKNPRPSPVGGFDEVF
jgi:hypothetical protein